MRILLATAVAIAAIFAFSSWSSNPTVAKQNGGVPIDPVVMMTTTTDLPAEQYAAF